MIKVGSDAGPGIRLHVFDPIPDSLGIDATIAQRWHHVVERIETMPLFKLLSNAFTLRPVFDHF